jgi:peptide deformylase
MNKPIMAYGNKVLRAACKDIEQDNGLVNLLTEELWQTLETSGGVGLAAPQINYALNAFVVDSQLMYEDLTTSQCKLWFPDGKGTREVFYNARILNQSPDSWSETEGCLSIPGINEEVKRAWSITVEYMDKNFILQTRKFSGFTAKVIQHEHDHLNGTLFIDHLPNIRKKLVSTKLKRVLEGKVETDYPIRFS